VLAASEAEKGAGLRARNVPQRLKPGSPCRVYGTSKVVPFQNINS
jgi:hypothetical protein